MKLYSIQFLRATAAILVVHCHSVDLQMKYNTSFQQTIFYLENFGSIGVDIFFVISGFIMSFIGSKYSGHQDAYSFLEKRFIRINPVYYFFSFIAFLIFLLKNNFEFSYKTVIKTILIIPLEFSYDIWWPILGVGWTLSFEWLFYLLFTLLILNKVNNKDIYLTLTLIVLVTFGAFFQSKYTSFITNPILLEFGAGSMIGWLFKNKKISKKISFILLLVSVLLFSLLIFFGYGNISESETVIRGTSSFQRVICFGIPSILLVLSCVYLENSETLKKYWKTKLFQVMGDASYSIYLVHLIIFSLLDTIYLRIGVPISADFAILFQVYLAIHLGIYAHLFIEKRIISLVTHLFNRVKFNISIYFG